MKPDRRPKWAKWKLLPEVKVWEAVALSLNIEPKQIKRERLFLMGATHPFKEGSEFGDRLDVTCENLLNTQHFPTSGTLNMEGKYRCGVSLREFASFAGVVAWEVPAELADLGRSTATSTGTENSPSFLKKRERQIRVVEEVAKRLFRNPLEIPDGGKTKIMLQCQKEAIEIFGVSEHSFDGAWKAARRQNRVRMANHNKFKSKP